MKESDRNTTRLRALTVNDIREGCRPSTLPALGEKSVYLNSTALSYLCGHIHTHGNTQIKVLPTSLPGISIILIIEKIPLTNTICSIC